MPALFFLFFVLFFFRVEHVTSSHHAKGRKDQGHAQWWTKSKSARSKKSKSDDLHVRILTSR